MEPTTIHTDDAGALDELVHDAGLGGGVEQADTQLIALHDTPDTQDVLRNVEDQQEQDRAERVALGGHGDGDAGGDHADGRQEDRRRRRRTAGP